MQRMSEPENGQNWGVRKFHDKPIRALSIVVMIFGVFSLLVGVATLTLALLETCFYEDRPDYPYYYHGTTIGPSFMPRHCRFDNTYGSAGIWSGFAYIASGIIGLFSSKRKTTCFIVTMMIMSVVTAWIALCAMTVSVAAQFEGDRTRPTENDWRYPWSLRILDGAATLLSLAVFVISWVKFGFACYAVCCNGKKAYPVMKQRVNKGYQPLPTQPMMYGNPHPAMTPVAGAQFTTPAPQPVEPIYLVQGRQIIGVLPQNLGQANQTQASSSGPDGINVAPVNVDPQNV